MEKLISVGGLNLLSFILLIVFLPLGIGEAATIDARQASGPLLPFNVNAASTESIRVGSTFRAVVGNDAPYLIIGAAILQDYGSPAVVDTVVQYERWPELRQISAVSLWGHQMIRSGEPYLYEKTYWTWYVSWMSSSPQDGYCELTPEVFDESGQILSLGVSHICDEICEISADDPTEVPMISAEVRQDTITVFWDSMPDVDRYTVLVWEGTPNPNAILTNLCYISERFPEFPQAGVSVGVSGATPCYVGVLAENRDVANSNGMCSGYSHYSVRLRGALEIAEVYPATNSTEVSRKRWGQVKWETSGGR